MILQILILIAILLAVIIGFLYYINKTINKKQRNVYKDDNTPDGYDWKEDLYEEFQIGDDIYMN